MIASKRYLRIIAVQSYMFSITRDCGVFEHLTGYTIIFALVSIPAHSVFTVL